MTGWDDYWGDDDGPWHCGLCGQKPCDCATDLVLVVRLPDCTAGDETDADLVAMSLVSMMNEQREANGGEAPPILLRHAAWWRDGVHHDPEAWLSDAMSVIHQHCGSDGSDDQHNDWVNDLANELHRVLVVNVDADAAAAAVPSGDEEPTE